MAASLQNAASEVLLDRPRQVGGARGCCPASTQAIATGPQRRLAHRLPTYPLPLGRREANDQPWQYLDEAAVQQVASNAPYAHWSWNTNAYSYDAAKPTWNCVMVGSCARSATGAACCCQIQLLRRCPCPPSLPWAMSRIALRC